MEAPIPICINKTIETISANIKQKSKVFKATFENMKDYLIFSIKNEKEIDIIYKAKLTLKNLKEMNRTMMRLCEDINDVIEFLKKKIENKKVSIQELNEKIIFTFFVTNKFDETESVEFELIKIKENQEEINAYLVKEVEELKKQLEQKDLFIKELLDSKLKKIEEKYYEMLNQVKEENEEKIKKMQKHYEEKITKLMRQKEETILAARGVIKEEIEEEKKTLGSFHYKKPIKVILSQGFKLKNGPNYKIINGNRAIKLIGGGWNATVLGDKILVKNKINKWKIRINKINFEIMIGIAYSDIDQSDSSNYLSQNTFALYSYNLSKVIHGLFINYGNGSLKNRDIVEIIVDMKKHFLEFILNGKSLGIAYDKLSDKINYLPYIELRAPGEEIELLDSVVE